MIRITCELHALFRSPVRCTFPGVVQPVRKAVCRCITKDAAGSTRVQSLAPVVEFPP